MTLTMSEITEKYGNSLRKSLLIGVSAGAAFTAGLNLLLYAWTFDLNLFMEATGVISVFFSLVALGYWRSYEQRQKKNLKKQVSMLFASDNDQ